jgi:hypothetical protein
LNFLPVIWDQFSQECNLTALFDLKSTTASCAHLLGVPNRAALTPCLALAASFFNEQHYCEFVPRMLLPLRTRREQNKAAFGKAGASVDKHIAYVEEVQPVASPAIPPPSYFCKSNACPAALFVKEKPHRGGWGFLTKTARSACQ